MNKLVIPFGASLLEATLDWGRSIGTLDIAEAPALPDLARVTREALSAPIGMADGFLDGFTSNDTVAVIVSDAYRRTAIDQILPILLNELAHRGVPDENIRFLFASGIHKSPSIPQQESILGSEVFARHRPRVFVHEPYDDDRHVQLGQTSRGTRVAINRLALECSRIIATGTVVLHYFGGFGGGRKSIVPGIASARTIAHNHAMNLHRTEDKLDPAVRIGALDGNPVAEDMLEAARFVPLHGIVNTVLNQRGEIAGLFVGEMDAAHRKASAFARQLYAVELHEQADVVIASAGAARNYVQSHKALYNAYQAMKPGGCIIFLAPCEEGLGGEVLEKWLRLGSTGAIIGALRKQSEIYGQTALSTLEKAPSAIFVTALREADVQLLGARKANDLCHALALAREKCGANARILTMPSASYTVPSIV